MARIVVCGYMVRHPLAGNLFAYFHYVLGLHRLGHEVAYVEENGWSGACYDPATNTYGDDPTPGLERVRTLFAMHGADLPVCYVDRERGAVYGAEWDELTEMLRDADLLLNLGGVCWLPEFRLCRRRALVDMDPVFTQVGLFGAKVLDDYHVQFSYGTNIGRPGCTVPTAGVDWLPVAPPVVTALWKGGPPPPGAAFTTIANWSAYGSVTHGGERYGQKDEEFQRLIDLPARTDQPLELALSGAPDEIAARFRAKGWSIRDAGAVSGDVGAYQRYIRASRGEFSAAKHAYVATYSGWFSDRTVCYLAAGRPAIVQETGFSDWLPTGRGVLGFGTADEAAYCLARVNADYATHAQAARDLAERFFSHRVVLPRLLAAALASGTRPRATV